MQNDVEEERGGGGGVGGSQLHSAVMCDTWWQSAPSGHVGASVSLLSGHHVHKICLTHLLALWWVTRCLGMAGGAIPSAPLLPPRRAAARRDDGVLRQNDDVGARKLE